MTRSAGLALIFLLTFLPAVEGQTRQTNGHNPDPGPISMLLARRAQLSLTEEQVAQITQIETEVDAKNRPLVQQVMTIRWQIRALGDRSRFTSEKRALYRTYTDQAKTPLEQLERNMKDATGRAIAVLTEAQRQQLYQIIRNPNSNRERSSNPPRFPHFGN